MNERIEIQDQEKKEERKRRKEERAEEGGSWVQNGNVTLRLAKEKADAGKHMNKKCMWGNAGAS